MLTHYRLNGPSISLKFAVCAFAKFLVCMVDITSAQSCNGRPITKDQALSVGTIGDPPICSPNAGCGSRLNFGTTDCCGCSFGSTKQICGDCPLDCAAGTFRAGGFADQSGSCPSCPRNTFSVAGLWHSVKHLKNCNHELYYLYD